MYTAEWRKDLHRVTFQKWAWDLPEFREHDREVLRFLEPDDKDSESDQSVTESLLISSMVTDNTAVKGSVLTREPYAITEQISNAKIEHYGTEHSWWPRIFEQ